MLIQGHQVNINISVTFLNRDKNTDRVHYIKKNVSLLILYKPITGNVMMTTVQFFESSPNAPK